MGSDMGHGLYSDREHWHFLNSTCNMGTPIRATGMQRKLLSAGSACRENRCLQVVHATPRASPQVRHPLVVRLNVLLAGWEAMEKSVS